MIFKVLNREIIRKKTNKIIKLNYIDKMTKISILVNVLTREFVINLAKIEPKIRIKFYENTYFFIDFYELNVYNIGVDRATMLYRAV